MNLSTLDRLLWWCQRRLLLLGRRAADQLGLTPTPETPRLTIISSVYDGDRFIEGFLADLVQQTCFDSCECLLLLPRSPGHEQTVISRYQQQYPNIRSFNLILDPGIYETWNLAVDLARGEFITNANLDDRRAPDYYEQALSRFRKEPELDLVSPLVLVTDHENENWHEHSAHTICYLDVARQNGGHYSAAELFRIDEEGIPRPRNLPHCMPIWRKQLHQRFGYFDEDRFGPSADWEFWLRCATGGARFFLIDQPMCLYLSNEHSYANTPKRAAHKQIAEAEIMRQYFQSSRDAAGAPLEDASV